MIASIRQTVPCAVHDSLDGTDIACLRGGALAEYRRTVGFVFQRRNLLPALTALDNVIVPVLPYRTSFEKRLG